MPLKLIHGVVLQRPHHIIHEALGVYVSHTCPRIALLNQLTDAVHKMSLAQTDAAVNK